jgi:hypothetical protein
MNLSLVLIFFVNWGHLGTKLILQSYFVQVSVSRRIQHAQLPCSETVCSVEPLMAIKMWSVVTSVRCLPLFLHLASCFWSCAKLDVLVVQCNSLPVERGRSVMVGQNIVIFRYRKGNWDMILLCLIKSVCVRCLTAWLMLHESFFKGLLYKTFFRCWTFLQREMLDDLILV